MSVQYTCTNCNKVTTVSSQWQITRKKYPGLCKQCAQELNPSKQTGRQSYAKLDWDCVYDDSTQTANTCKEAKSNGLKFYKGYCSVHGNMPYATLDNTCRICTRERAKKRNKDNVEFNRPRVIVAAIRRRARQRGLPCTITTADIRGQVPDKCPVLGIPIEYVNDRNNFDTSPSIDQFEPSKGYTPDNIEIISNRANRLKSDGTAKEHLLVAMWMLKRESACVGDEAADGLIRTITQYVNMVGA